MSKIDPYNVYGECLNGEKGLSEMGFIRKIAKKHSRIINGEHFWPFVTSKFDKCRNNHGIEDYFTINKAIFNTDTTIDKFHVCS